MHFQINDQVVHPGFGLGRVVGRATQTFGQAVQQEYYEVAGLRSTVWVPVAQGAQPGLRPLTPKAELPRYRGVLSGQPASLNPDFRRRQLEMRSKAGAGTLLGICEVVRDLSARNRSKPLNDYDANVLRRSHQALCEEWAAADDVSLPEATNEVNTLLQAGWQSFQA